MLIFYKMKNIFLSLLVILLVVTTNFAQPPAGHPLEKIEMLAGDNLEKYDTWNALDLYKKVFDKKPDDAKAVYDVAYTYFLLRDYPDAEEWFKKLLDVDKDGIYKLSKWYYAYSLKLNGKYKECIQVYGDFIATYQEADAERLKALANIEIEGAKWAIKVTQPYEELIITNAGKNINSPLMENYAYPVGREKIIFSSLRSDTIIFVDKVEDDSKFVKIFSSEYDSQTKEWKEAKEFEKAILNVEGFHSVNPTFNEDMSKFYFSRAKLTGNMLENSQILSSKYNGVTMSEPIVLDFNREEYSCKNPAVGKMNGKEYLFFSSNMPGGKGGYDIWYAEIMEDGLTRQPLNMESVNSIGDDVYPFYDQRDKTLYFASSGFPGMGGLDMFTSTMKNDGSWGEVKNMGPGFNTSLDEFGFIITREGKDDCYGYFISNRNGTTTIPGKVTSTDDIFSVLMPDRCNVDVTVNIYDNDTKSPINGATVQLMDKSTGKVIETMNPSGSSCTFSLEQGKEYNVVSTKEGYETLMPVSIDTRKSSLEKRFGKVEKPMTWEEKTYVKETGLIVETFNRKTNEPLSGVKVTVMNANSGEVMKESELANSNRHEFKMARTNDIKIKARLAGYVGETKSVAKADMKTIQKLYLTPPPIFINVYFDFDKSNIRKGAADTLDVIAGILTEYTDMVVEVRGHTDSKGSNEYNDKLSVRRSNAAMEYLVAKGIDATRLIPKGFGEVEPIAPNEKTTGEDDPDGRQMNRRVEFKIIKGEGATEVNTTSEVPTEEKKK